jgi:hypothetical protein
MNVAIGNWRKERGLNGTFDMMDRLVLGTHLQCGVRVVCCSILLAHTM